MTTGNAVKQEPQEWPPLGWLTKEVAAIRLGLSESRTAALAKEGKLQDWKQRNPQSKTGQMVTLIRAGDVEKVLWERDHPEEAIKLPAKVDKPFQMDWPGHIAAVQSVAAWQASMSKPWMTIQQAAEFSGLPIFLIRKLIRCGELPALSYDSSWRIKRTDLEKLEGHR